MAVTANLAGPYIAVLNVLKLALMVMAVKEVGQGIMGGMGDEEPTGEGPKLGDLFKRKEPQQAQTGTGTVAGSEWKAGDKITVQVVYPAEGAEIPLGKQPHPFQAIASDSSQSMPKSGKFQWFLDREELVKGDGSFRRGRTLFQSKKDVEIPASKFNPGQACTLHIKILDWSQKHLVGEGARHVKIGQPVKVKKGPKVTNPTWRELKPQSPGSNIAELIKVKPFEKFTKDYQAMLTAIQDLKNYCLSNGVNQFNNEFTQIETIINSGEPVHKRFFVDERNNNERDFTDLVGNTGLVSNASTNSTLITNNQGDAAFAAAVNVLSQFFGRWNAAMKHYKQVYTLIKKIQNGL